MIFTEFNLEDAQKIWFEEGMEEGVEGGIKNMKKDIEKKAVEIARGLLRMNMSVDDVAATTDLNRTEVGKLNNEVERLNKIETVREMVFAEFTMEDAKQFRFEQGIERGLEIVEKGIEKGIKACTIDIAQNLLNEGCLVENISKITGLTEEEVSKLAH